MKKINRILDKLENQQVPEEKCKCTGPWDCQCEDVQDKFYNEKSPTPSPTVDEKQFCKSQTCGDHTDHYVGQGRCESKVGAVDVDKPKTENLTDNGEPYNNSCTEFLNVDCRCHGLTCEFKKHVEKYWAHKSINIEKGDKPEKPQEQNERGKWKIMYGIRTQTPGDNAGYDKLWDGLPTDESVKPEKIKCTCPCHNAGVAMMHFVPCCDNGFIEVSTPQEQEPDSKPDFEKKRPDFNDWIKSEEGENCNDWSSLDGPVYLQNRLFWAFDAGRNCVWDQYIKSQSELTQARDYIISSNVKTEELEDDLIQYLEEIEKLREEIKQLRS